MFDGSKHSDETRRKMSEAGKHIWAQRREKKADNGYRMLMAAIVHQAIKDGAVWFLESGIGKSYCVIAGINPAKFQGGGNHGTENKPGREIQRG